MSSRSYLSIGDVLTLLRQEFPDVTISKIRFLESQGLVNPERTPSGYRKFYEHDVERLRWVLRQQREHFLPLKVIKDRLETGDVDEPVAVGAAETATAVVRTAARAPSRASGAATRSSAGEDVDAAPAPPAEIAPAPAAASSPVLVGNAGASPLPAAAVRPVEAPAVARLVASQGGPGRVQPADAEPPVVRADAPTGGSTPSRPEPPAAAGEHATPPPPATPRVATPAQPATPSAPKSAVAPVPTPAPAPAKAQSPPPAGADVSGASLTMGELSTASGTSVEVLEQLREFGLIAPQVVGGAEYFGEDALAVANLAAGFAAYGVEPRHLRLYKNAAEREAGFVEQVIMPLVRQRNPEARSRAVQTANDLAKLGQSLRSVLLRKALRDLLGS